MVSAVAGNIKLGIHGRIAHAGFGTALIGQNQFIRFADSLCIRKGNLRFVMVNRLAAEKLVFLLFALAERRLSQQICRIGLADDFRLIHIVPVGNLETDVHTVVGNGKLRHECLFRRQQIVRIQRESPSAQHQKYGEQANQFFHNRIRFRQIICPYYKR